MLINGVIWNLIGNKFKKTLREEKFTKYAVITDTPRTAETGTFQAYQQVHQYAAMDLHSTTTVQKLQQTILINILYNTPENSSAEISTSLIQLPQISTSFTLTCRASMRHLHIV